MILTLPAPCWHFEPNSNAYDRDPHFDTEAEAARFHDEYDEGGSLPTLLPAPCVVVICDGCERRLADEVVGVLHFPSEGEARSLSTEYGFVVLDDGSAWCGGCKLRPHAHVGKYPACCDRCDLDIDEHETAEVAAR